MSGISVVESVVNETGLELDREFMLVDENGTFISQRQFSNMSLFKTSIENDVILVSCEGEHIEIPLKNDETVLEKVKVWSSNMKAYHIGDEFDNWFSKRLGYTLKLVRLSSEHKRYKRLFVPPFKTHVSFADGYPYLFLGTASVDALNQRLTDKLSYDRFRPNVLLESELAHEEDNLKSFKLGSAQFKNIKPCARCQIINIDQSSGTPSKEPLRALSDYRKQGNKVLFGTNVICLTPGRIAIGDEIIVI